MLSLFLCHPLTFWWIFIRQDKTHVLWTASSSTFYLIVQKMGLIAPGMLVTNFRITTLGTQKHSLCKTFLKRKQWVQPLEQCALQTQVSVSSYPQRGKAVLGPLLGPIPQRLGGVCVSGPNVSLLPFVFSTDVSHRGLSSPQ